MKAHENQTHKEILKKAYNKIQELQSKLDRIKDEKEQRIDNIAVIGMSCRFPGGANNPDTYWKILNNGIDTISKVPAERWSIDTYHDNGSENPEVLKTQFGGFLDVDIRGFDHKFFKLTPKEVKALDPQQRLLLEVTWEALEYAGINPLRLQGSNTGVFVGISYSDYAKAHLLSGIPEKIVPYALTGTALSAASGRISYTFDLQGPCLSIDTACSSSLVATHYAIQSLRHHESDMAIAGGVSTLLAPETSIGLSRLGTLSVDGRCKAFSDMADGYGRGEGCGIILLKRLTDALNDGDSILAVIKGSAVNHDGRSNGLTAPNVLAQEAVIRQAMHIAGISTEDIDYIETHGTGTPLGDQTEVQALANVFASRKRDVLIGTVKTNIGHLEAASGIAGLIKLILSLKHEQIPRHLHCEHISNRIEWDCIPIKVTVDPVSWHKGDRPRTAGISTFGFSGTNAHIILQEAPQVKDTKRSDIRHSHLFTLSAATESSLHRLLEHYSDYLENTTDNIADICYTLNVSRTSLQKRFAIQAATKEQVLTCLKDCLERPENIDCYSPVSPDINNRVVFLFSGHYTHYRKTGKELYENSVAFKDSLDRCDSLFQCCLQGSLVKILYSDETDQDAVNQPLWTLPIIFSLEYALGQFWQSLNIRPAAVTGYGIGELAAACMAGIFSLEDAVHMVALYGKMVQHSNGRGKMVEVLSDTKTLEPLISAYRETVSIAAINSPTNFTLSGKAESIDHIIAVLESQKIFTVTYAFYPIFMEPHAAELEKFIQAIAFRKPVVPILYSNDANTPIDSRQYWSHHFRNPIYFRNNLKSAVEKGFRIFLEIGSTASLSELGRESFGRDDAFFLPALVQGRTAWEQVAGSLGRLYVFGVPVDWETFHKPFNVQKIQLPLYSFERKQHWMELQHHHFPNSESEATAHEKPGMEHRMIEPKLCAQQSTESREHQEENECILKTKRTGTISTNADIPASEKERERVLTEIWQDILDLEQPPGVADSFFQSGGDSLTGNQLISRIHHIFKVKLPIEELFNAPTIAALSHYLTQASTSVYVPVRAVGPRPFYPLSAAQKRLFFLHRYAPDALQYNMPAVLTIEGALDVARLTDTFQQLVQRHETFRTGFRENGGEPVQVIEEHCEVVIETQVPEDSAKIDQAIREFIRPFDLSRPPLLRVKVFRVDTPQVRAQLPPALSNLAETVSGEQQPLHLLCVDMHHIITDGVSSGILIDEIMKLYHDEPLPDLHIQYKDYAMWQQERQQQEQEHLEQQKLYWVNLFSGDVPLLNLPTDFPRPAVQSHEGASLHVAFGSGLTRQLRQFAHNHEVTLYMLLLAVYNVLLHKYTCQEDIIVGTPTAGRQHVDLEPLMGMFVNTLVLRNFPTSEQRFSTFLQAVKARTLQGFQHQDYQFEALIEHLKLHRDISRHPLFDTMLVLQNMAIKPLELKGLRIGPYAFEHATAKFDLCLIFTENEEDLSIDIEYCTKLFRRTTIERLSGHFLNIVHAILRDPQQKLGMIDMLSSAEKQQILYEFNATKTVYSRDKTVPQLFEEQVERTPDKVAVVFEDRKLTYRELNTQANKLGHYLQKNGVRAETLVGICLERSVEMIVALLGILKAGAAYVPFDPDYPQKRLQFMVEDTQPQVIVTCERFASKFPSHSAALLCINTVQETLKGQPVSAPQSATTPEHVAYIMYTSGSTGHPKGVSVPHRAIVRLVKNTTYAVFDASEVFLHAAPISFDASTFEIWGSLLNGARLVLLPAGPSSIESLGHTLRKHQITTLWLTAGLFHLMVDHRLEDLRGLHQLLAGGDVLSVPHVCKALNTLDTCQLINGYGPTENTTFTCCFPIPASFPMMSSVPIGRPVSNTQVYILDAALQPVPIAVTGELYTGGDGLAHGYFKRPALTQERFIRNPFSPDPASRLYKTGDLARWLQDGTIEFLGRLDEQVKIRGFRIEPGEIETALEGLETVGAAVVLTKPDSTGTKRLVAYVVPAHDPASALEQASNLNIEQLRNDLSKILPDYMIPSLFVKIDALPLTSNGKIDKHALPEPEEHFETTHKYVAPETETAKKLAAIWKEILGMERIGIHDNFFELGGHSLTAIRLVSKIHHIFKVQLPLRELFETPTIEALSRYLTIAETSLYTSITPIAPRSHYPLSAAQKRLFFLHLYEPDNVLYNMPEVLIVEGELDMKRLEHTFQQLVQRHETLRTGFCLIDGVPMQEIADFCEVRIDNQFLEDFVSIEQLMHKFIQPFDLSRAPLLRVKVFQVAASPAMELSQKGTSESTVVGSGEQKPLHLLCIDMHHIISDGMSVAIFIDEFMKLYHGESLPDLRIQYKEYAVWQQEQQPPEYLEQQKHYWLNLFSGDIPILNLPTDFPRPAVQSFKGALMSISFGYELTDQLREFARTQRVTLYMLLLAIYNVLLLKYTGQEDIVVGTLTTGRRHTDLEPLLGMFVNTLALRNSPTSNQPFSTFLQAVKDRTLQGFQHQEYQFDELVDRLQLQRDTSRHPLFNTRLVLQNIAIKPLELEGLRIRPYPFERNIALFDLYLTFNETRDGLYCDFEYCTTLFRRETIERFSRHFLNIARTILQSPQQNLGEIEMLSIADKEQILHKFNATQVVHPREKMFHQLFEEQVERIPDHVAVVFEDQVVSYRELNERANKLAHYLQKQGVCAETLVAICMERSVEIIVGLLGIFKAGGAYMPIDPAYPQDRIAYMLEHSACALLLTRKSIEAILPEKSIAPVLCLDDIRIQGVIKNESSRNVITSVHPHNLAYVIYTSGSTGRPKGVMIEHAGMLNHLYAKIYDLQLTAHSIVAQNASVCFDISVWQFFAALVVGGTTVIYSEDCVLEPARFIQAVNADHVTILEVVPSYLSIILEYLEATPRHAIRLDYLLVTGEEVRADLVRRWFAQFPYIPMVNAYGPTEASDDITHHIMVRPPDSDWVPIGKPVQNLHIYIVDPLMKLCPIGAKGEICVAGIGVGRGYLHNPEKTLEVFINDPFSTKPGVRLYKTGDMGCWNPDGTIRLFGRKDRQVKIRGFRIELDEIERQIVRYEQIQEAVTIVHKNEQMEKYLCAYVVSKSELDIIALRTYLSRHLPDYMVPAVFVKLNSLPLTLNGKIDIKALPAPEKHFENIHDFVAPQTEIEKRLAAIWKDVLFVERVGIQDDFFELGGNSLTAIQLISKIHRTFEIEMPLRDFFTNSTIKLLSLYLMNTTPHCYTAIPPAGSRPYYPLSAAQKRLFFLHHYAPDALQYNLPVVLMIEGALDLARLTDTFQQLVSRHETFRTRFRLVDDEPVQEIVEHCELQIETQILDNANDVCRFVQEFIRPFDLSRAPLLRVKAFQAARAITGELSSQEFPENTAVDSFGQKPFHLLCIDMHHIITDGVSTGILVDEFMKLYHDESLPDLRIQYKDYAVWQQEQQQHKYLEQQRDYWQELFSSEVSVLNLQTDFPRPSVQSFEGATLSIKFDSDVYDQLRQFAYTREVTLYMLLLAAYNVLLFKYTSQEDIIVGLPTAGRRHADLEPLIGMFVNTLALRNFPTPDQTFITFLQAVKAQTLQSFEHQDYQFEELIDHLQLRRDSSRHPLFDTMLVLQNMQIKSLEIEGLRIRSYPFKRSTAKFDLCLIFNETDEGLHVDFEYCTKLFRPATIKRLSQHFLIIVREILRNPQQTLGEIDILSSGEKELLLYTWNATHAEYPREKTMTQLFEEQVEKTPDQAALIFEDEEVTYRELNIRANKLGHYLRQQGVRPESLVGICIERSVEMIVGILGILKAGGAYVPIDPTYPKDRIAFMLEDSNCALLLTQASIQDILPETLATPILCLDDERTLFAIEKKSGKNVLSDVHSNNLIYVIYTSGSTGKQKGVMIEHRSVMNLVTSQLREYNFTDDETILQFSSICFDASVEQIWIAFGSGATLALVRNTTLLDEEQFSLFLEQRRITYLNAVPTFLKRIKPKPYPSLKRILSGGESCDRYLAQTWSQEHIFYNKYGPTETTVTSTRWRVPSQECINTVPIGNPINNTRIYILDTHQQLLPAGVAGELYIAGDGLARGYLNRPALTAEKFIRDPFAPNPGARMYRTGDLARWLPDGTIEFLGRLDDQVKVRGFRIELGEIEAALQSLDHIRTSVVMAKKDHTGNTHLVAYIVPAREQSSDPEYVRELSINQLRDDLSKTLPGYMIPSLFVKLDSLPLTPSGKVNKHALPAPEGRIETANEYVTPKTGTEKSLAAIWQDVLGVDRVGVYDNFFDLGGDSLKMIILLNRVYKQFHIKISVNDFYHSSTIYSLATLFGNTNKETFSSIQPVEKKEFYATSSAQKRIFIVHMRNTRSTSYNITTVWHFEGELDRYMFADVLKKIVARHDSLRTSFLIRNGEIIQKVAEKVPFEIDYIKTTNTAVDAEIHSCIMPFDLHNAPLFRVALMQIDKKNHIVVADMHHIISDGVSGGLMLREIMKLYKGEELPPLKLQYRDYTEWLNTRLTSDEVKTQHDYWLNRLKGELPLLNLITDNDRSTKQTFIGDTVETLLDDKAADIVLNMCRTYHATLYMIFQALFSVLLSKYSGQVDIILGTPISGRDHADLENIVGMFVNVLIMRSFPDPQKTFYNFLCEVIDDTLQAFNNKECQFDELYKQLHYKRENNRNPVYDVVFAVMNMDIPDFTIPGLRVHPYERYKDNTCKTDLRLGITEKDKRIILHFTYNVALFKRESIVRMSKHLMEIIGTVGMDIHMKLEDIALSTRVVSAKVSDDRLKSTGFNL